MNQHPAHRVSPPTPQIEFEHRWPSSTIVFRRGAIGDVAQVASQLRPRAVAVINDPAAHAAAQAIAADFGPLAKLRVDDVAMHVSSALVDATLEDYRAAGIDLTVSVGGGSAMGLAKGIALRTGIPILAVPTTYAGSEMTSIWGLTDDGSKVTGRDQAVRPFAVCYDPALTETLPISMSVTSGLNAIAHCAEALYSPHQSPLGTMAAAAGVRSITTALLDLTRGADSRRARDAALEGAWLAGTSLEVSTMGLHHRICHVLGGLLDLPHSPLHAVVLPHAVGFGMTAAPAAAAAMAAAIEQGRADSGGEIRPPTPAPGRHERTGAVESNVGAMLWDLCADLGAPLSLHEIGMSADDLGVAIDTVAEAIETGTLVNPRPVSRADVARLIETALAGERPDNWP